MLGLIFAVYFSYMDNAGFLMTRPICFLLSYKLNLSCFQLNSDAKDGVTPGFSISLKVKEKSLNTAVNGKSYRKPLKLYEVTIILSEFDTCLN